MAGFVLLILALCAATVAPVSATYTIQMRFRRYFNPENHDFNGHCCDGIIFCHVSPCDVYFTFCLRAVNTPATTTGSCWQFKSTSSNPIEDNLFTAPETGPIYPNSPVSNYITFQGNSYPSNGFQMSVRIEDEDIDPDDLVDVVQFNLNPSPGSGWTSYTNVNGHYGRAQIDARFKVYCNTNYYGSNCAKYCAPTDNSQGHYTCASNGNKVCNSGWTNVNNNCLTPVCTSGCSTVGGYCNSPNQCLCHNGWSGSLCNQCIPSSACVHGTCNSPGQCLCNTGYGGANCDQDLDVCGHQQPCLHDGSCSNEGPDQHSCSCVAGYTGNNCQTDINECGPLPCLNGATCNDNLNHFSCLCAAGWTGNICSVNINECDPNNPCQNGNCTDLVNGYSCQCEPGWTGAECEVDIDECQSIPCQNNANCTDLVNRFTCQCATGWTGKTCTQDINDCDPNPCQNRGNCTDELAGYQCDCAVGYYGKSCEDHYCDSSPCDNGATCTGTADGYVCTCPRSVTGTNCSVDINECGSFPCKNGATCENLVGDYSCTCPDQYRGKDCEYNEQIPQCSPNPCPRGLTCAEGTRTDYVCIQCSDQGADCNFVIDSEALAANATQQGSTLLIGAAVGGIGGALLLVCLLAVLLVVITVCCCRTAKNTEEPYPQDDEKGYVPNPTYKSTTTLVSTNKDENFHPYDVPDYSRDVPNPLYASSSPGITLPLNGAVQGKTSEDCKQHSAVALSTNSAHFTQQYNNNVYTYDPTEDEEDINKESMYSEVGDDDLKKTEAPPAVQPVENVYDYIPGDIDPSVVYEKLPPQMPF